MTIKEMDNVIQDYCCNIGETSDELCGGCLIKHLCEAIEGDFEHNPDALRTAYELITVDKPSKVDHPSHYNQGGIECIDAMVSAFGKEATAIFCHLNAFKYLWRTDAKNGMEDIDKALWYLNKYKGLKSNE